MEFENQEVGCEANRVHRNSGGDSAGGKEMMNVRIPGKEESPGPQPSCYEPLLY